MFGGLGVANAPSEPEACSGGLFLEAWRLKRVDAAKLGSRRPIPLSLRFNTKEEAEEVRRRVNARWPAGGAPRC